MLPGSAPPCPITAEEERNRKITHLILSAAEGNARYDRKP
jgi:hypothetical protein